MTLPKFVVHFALHFAPKLDTINHMKTHLDAREVVRKLREVAQTETSSVTFRFPKRLLKQFKFACDQEGIKPNAVVKELIQDFVLQVKQ